MPIVTDGGGACLAVDLFMKTSRTQTLAVLDAVIQQPGASQRRLASETGLNLAKINQILANYQINIVGQYLKTNEKIGYVITDIDKVYDPEAIEALKNIPGTIRFRTLY